MGKPNETLGVPSAGRVVAAAVRGGGGALDSQLLGQCRVFTGWIGQQISPTSTIVTFWASRVAWALPPDSDTTGISRAG